MKNKPKKTIPQLKQKLDEVFSKFIRKRDKGKCFTCGVKKRVKKMQNGHYWSRTYSNTRYDEINCNTQCVGCNIFKEGNKPVYTLQLINKYGVDVLKELEKKARQEKKWVAKELLELIEKYEKIT